SLVLALGWTTNLGTYLIRRGKTPEATGANRARAEDAGATLSVESAEPSQEEQMRRMMAAEEASLEGGWFGRIIQFYERWLRRALEHPVWLAGLCVILIGIS